MPSISPANIKLTAKYALTLLSKSRSPCIGNAASTIKTQAAICIGMNSQTGNGGKKITSAYAPPNSAPSKIRRRRTVLRSSARASSSKK